MTTFNEGDIVVVNDPNFIAESYAYDYSLWAKTRMRVTSVDGDLVFTEAIDERPDRQWLMNTSVYLTGDPQEKDMLWPGNLLKLAS